MPENPIMTRHDGCQECCAPQRGESLCRHGQQGVRQGNPQVQPRAFVSHQRGLRVCRQGAVL